MNVMVIGSGAREHALVWKIIQSPTVKKVYVVTGNGGTATHVQNIALDPLDFPALRAKVVDLGIDMTVVGPEIPLAAGIVDYFEEKKLPVIGPSKAAARIESSKSFSKTLMQKYGIPCGRSESFSDYTLAKKYVASQKMPVVIKADGLAAGKGVVIAFSQDEAQTALSDMMVSRTFGTAGDRIIVEEYLEGKEISVLAFTDGKTVVPMQSACDYKRAHDNDEGLNTGGMGAYSPAGFIDEKLIDTVVETVIKPVVLGLASEGCPYKGVLYAGIMLTGDGPKVLEFNARFGDPETQVILPRLKTDIMDIFQAIYRGTLSDVVMEWDPRPCVGVVLASGGYPGDYKKGFAIRGLDTVDLDIMVFHGGTRKPSDTADILTDGGRVLTVVACAETMTDARTKVYSNVKRITFDGAFYRSDIAAREVR